MHLLVAHHRTLHCELIRANLSKVVDVFQGLTESPTVHLKGLLKVYRTYTLLIRGPQEHPDFQHGFVTQSTLDIQHKLQMLKGFSGMSTLQLAEVAQNVCHNREEVTKKVEGEKEKGAKKNR